MRLRKPCEHNLYDAHEMSPVDRSLFKGWTDGWCPGGEFLPEGALVIEKVDGEWPTELLRKASQSVVEDLMARQRMAEQTGSTFWLDPEMTVRACVVALASQVGESE